MNVHPKTILLVDDDENFREILKIRLQKEGFNVVEADNGLIALETLKNLKPDLILLDVVMPIMNGIDTLFELKKYKNTRDIKVIMMTNKINIETELGEKYKQIIEKFGAVDFISKTLDLEQIAQRLKIISGFYI